MKNEFDTYSRVQELAAARSMTLSGLARNCGISPSTLTSKRKRGGQIQMETILRICDGLEITIYEFFTPPNRSA